jgi:hypothetical protein
MAPALVFAPHPHKTPNRRAPPDARVTRSPKKFRHPGVAERDDGEAIMAEPCYAWTAGTQPSIRDKNGEGALCKGEGIRATLTTCFPGSRVERQRNDAATRDHVQ